MNSTSAAPCLRALPDGATTAAPLPCFGRWQTTRLLGAGNFTSVYQARPLDCPAHAAADYALKVSAPKQEREEISRALLRREACVARQVSHANLVSVLGAQLDESPAYLVLPFLRGVTLRAVLAAGHRPRLPQALWILRQTAEALAALHAQGWLHGDVKPENLLISPSGHVTLLDLGFARRLHERATAGQALVGTPRYQAPELLDERFTGAGSADLYSLGITLFEALTGQAPFSQSDASALALAHVRETPADVRALVPQLPARLARLVRRLLAKEPLRRPTAVEAVAVLAALEIETLDLRVAG